MHIEIHIHVHVHMIYIYIYASRLFVVRWEGSHQSLEEEMGHDIKRQLDACATRTAVINGKVQRSGANGSNRHEMNQAQIS